MNSPGKLHGSTVAPAPWGQGGIAPTNPHPARISLTRRTSGNEPEPSASTVMVASGSRSDTSPAYSGAASEPALSPTTTTSVAPGKVAAAWSSAVVPLTYPLWCTARPGAYSVVVLPRWASPVQYGTYTME